MRKTLATFTLCCLAMVAAGHQQPDDPLTVATKLVNATRAFLTGHSETPGVTVSVREYSRSTEQGRLTVRYHAYVHGVAADRLFTVFSWPINAKQPSPIIGGASLGSDGIVMCAGKTRDQCGSADNPNDPIEFMFYPAKGEPSRVMLVAEDQKTTVMFGVVPDPLLKTDHGCSVEAIRLLPKWELVLVRAKGFSPNASLRFSSKSGTESHNEDVKADSNGEYSTALLPAVKGKASGKTEISISASDCSPALSFDWGKM